MRALIQRVSHASVTVSEKVIGRIESGLLILIGIEDSDSDEDIEWLSQKISNIRIFNDNKGKMNKSVVDINGGLLLVSQFTLHAATKKGNRPSFIRAARPEKAIPLYEKFKSQLSIKSGIHVESGEFGAMMKVELLNDGPVTIWIDSKNKE